MNTRRFELVPLVVTLLAVAGVCLFLFRGEAVAARIGPLFARTYDFLLMVVIGSGVSVLFQTISHGRDLREKRRALQREIHRDLVAGYNDAKKARRLLRARARRTPEGQRKDGEDSIDVAEYDRQLEALSSAQLSIELAARRIAINRSLFVCGGELIESLRIVAKYLNAIVDEWEDVQPIPSPDSSSLPLEHVPQLRAFLRDWRSSPPFRDGFKAPFDKALQLLEQALLSRG